MEVVSAKSEQTTAGSSVCYAQVAIDQPLEGELTYQIPRVLAADVKVGSRVSVPLGRGNRLITGTVLEVLDTPPAWMTKKENDSAAAHRAPVMLSQDGSSSEAAAFATMLESSDDASFIPSGQPGPHEGGKSSVKEIKDVLREVLPVPQDLLELARWISAYYCTPIGVTLSTMVPAAVKRATRLPQRVLIHLTDAARDRELFLSAVKLSPKTKKLYDTLLEYLKDGPHKEQEVLTHAGTAKPTLRRLMEKGIVRIERQIQWPTFEGATAPDHLRAGVLVPPEIQTPPALVLSADQQAALESIEPLLNPAQFAVRLIHGVTGSGKTELYIRAIEKVVAAGKRAIVLVPEISLTPQTVKRFTQRFDRVAVLHSGLRDAQRHQHWHAIASGWAQVIVGARSAIFAPAANLGIIVVDEEHDASYKQDNAPRYHGRDVAIRRAQMLGIPVLLGSATPALESWHNAQTNPNYKLLSLPTRPMGTQMPRVVIVDMKQQSHERRGLHILSTTLEHHLKQTLEKKKQAIFLLNRRGYAHYVMRPAAIGFSCATTAMPHW